MTTHGQVKLIIPSILYVMESLVAHMVLHLKRSGVLTANLHANSVVVRHNAS